jgi:FolB domain-containing protein
MAFPYFKDKNGEYLDQVQLTGMLLSCVIGIFPNERHKKQPVNIDLCLYLNTRPAAVSTNIYDTVDYSAVVKEISFILEQCEFLLIETAVEAVCSYFLEIYCLENKLPQVDAVAVRISKPSALTYGIIPSIQIARRRVVEQSSKIKPVSCNKKTIHESPLGRLTLVKVAPNEIFETRLLSPTAKSILTLGKFSENEKTIKSHFVLADLSTHGSLTNLTEHEQMLVVFS